MRSQTLKARKAFTIKNYRVDFKRNYEKSHIFKHKFKKSFKSSKVVLPIYIFV